MKKGVIMQFLITNIKTLTEVMSRLEKKTDEYLYLPQTQKRLLVSKYHV